MMYARAEQEVKHIPIYIYMYIYIYIHGNLGFFCLLKKLHLDSAPLVTVDVIGADAISPTGGLHTFATFRLWMA